MNSTMCLFSAYKQNIHFHMLSTLVLNRITEKVDNTNIITMDQRGLLKGTMELQKKGSGSSKTRLLH